MAQHNLGATGHDLREPLSTICAAGSQQQLVTSHLAVLRNNQDTRAHSEPLPTITTSGGHFAEVRAFLTTYYGSDQDTKLGEPLPTITTRDRFGLVQVWRLEDIGMRMLSPRELFRANGFPESYILDPIYRGKALTKTAQVRCCGNSVCPPVAAALVAANLGQGQRQMEEVA
jgi:DNA (cytosine-5)-methyltransferase 1